MTRLVPFIARLFAFAMAAPPGFADACSPRRHGNGNRDGARRIVDAAIVPR